jgi:hypothetical protein
MRAFVAARQAEYDAALSAFESASEAWIADDSYESAYEVARLNFEVAYNRLQTATNDWFRGY